MRQIDFETGKGAKRDDAQAFQWYKKAADQGFAAAQPIGLEDGQDQMMHGFLLGGGVVKGDEFKKGFWMGTIGLLYS